jgi:hypothetical protein
MLRMVRGQQPATPFQRSFARAGHAHAGVLVILALVGQMLADAAALDGVVELLARNGIWLAAVLFPAGFFLSSEHWAAVVRTAFGFPVHRHSSRRQ